MAITTPTINRIIRMTEFDLLRTAIKKYNMYMCIDSQKLYYDQSDSQRVQYYYVGVKTVNDLMYNITPAMNTTYYCWEDNSLWLWMNKWISIYSDTTYPSGYVYDDSNYISPTDEPSVPIDQNGLLKDGSVVVRDRQRIIKGKIYIDDGMDNLVISSYLGGGVRILPNGKVSTDGELYIDDEGKSLIRAEWNILNHEAYVDYTEHPELDDNPYKNDTHRYLVYHQGNIDEEALKVLTPEDIYKKLQDSSLPSPLELNVSQLSGMTAADFALKNHTHTANQITDFATAAQAQAAIQIRSDLTKANGEGITISYDNSAQQYKFSADSFRLTLTGGVTGSGTISHLANTSIALTVDPLKHIHQNYIDRMDEMQQEIDDLQSIDHNNYYTKTETNALIEAITPTDTPVAGFPLKVNSQGKLPVTATSADKLASNVTFNLTGDISGTATTNFSSSPITISTSADSIISSTPTAGKALKLDANGNLPTNAKTASALNHQITMNLTGGAIGTATLDTSSSTFTMNTTLDVPKDILTESDIGTVIPGLDENGKVPLEQLPPLPESLEPKGMWNPSSGAPSKNPEEGQFWIANAEGTFGDDYYYIGDWCLYLNGKWNYVGQSTHVVSVNNKTGQVVLTYTDVNAVSDELIDYSVGSTIPANKIVRTSANGRITGATVDKLTNKFDLISNSQGDVIFSDDSINTTTDGSADLNVNMTLTSTGLSKIKEQTGYIIANNGAELPHRKTLNFEGSVTIEDNGTDTISVLVGENKNTILLYWNGTANDSDILSLLNDYYANRGTKKIIIFWTSTLVNKVHAQNIVIDATAPDAADGSSYSIYGSSEFLGNNFYSGSGNNYYRDYVGGQKVTLTYGMLDSQPAITGIKTENYTTYMPGYLSTNGSSDGSNIFTPTKPNHPVNKQYMDNILSHLGVKWYNVNVNISGSIVTLNVPDKVSEDYTDTTLYFKLGQAIKGTSTSQKTFTIDSITINGTKLNFNDNQYFAKGTAEVFGAGTILEIYLGSNSDSYLVGIPYKEVDVGRYVTTIGNGVATSIDVKHNLNSTDLITEYRDTSGNKVYLDDKIKDANTITVSAVNAIPKNGIKVSILRI